MLSAVPKGLGSNPIEGVDVCKSIVLLWHGDSLNSLRAASALMKLVEGQERWEAPDYLQGVLLKIEWNRAKSYYHLHGAQSYG
ncbi:hypothetical protein TNCV_1388351 [Trichonephila clavipes]|nr:hypothetical protein TNCV_1388351 [Trichonephila clavipes]